MSTLVEIEKAADALPEAQQLALLRHLEAKLHGDRSGGARLVVENGQPVLVAPPGAPVMTPEFVKQALADFP
jgi:predicted ATPase